MSVRLTTRYTSVGLLIIIITTITYSNTTTAPVTILTVSITVYVALTIQSYYISQISDHLSAAIRPVRGRDSRTIKTENPEQMNTAIPSELCN